MQRVYRTSYMGLTERKDDMKTVTLYKAFDPDPHFGGYFWREERVWNDWDGVYSEAYHVEIPDDFYLGETAFGETKYFKKGDNRGYDVITMSDAPNCLPYFCGGKHNELIKLKVLGSAE